MPTANTFTALGKGNGFPFTCNAATDSEINAIDGETFASGGGVRSDGKLRLEELEFIELFPYIWNLYSVKFPDITISTSYASGEPLKIEYKFPNAAIYKMGDIGEGYVDLDELTPRKRVCFEPDLTLSPLRNQGDVAEADIISEQDDPGPGDPPSSISGLGYARFDVHGICFATDTKKYYLVYMSGLYADDQTTLIQEIPFSELNFDYYTYN